MQLTLAPVSHEDNSPADAFGDSSSAACAAAAAFSPSAAAPEPAQTPSPQQLHHSMAEQLQLRSSSELSGSSRNSNSAQASPELFAPQPQQLQVQIEQQSQQPRPSRKRKRSPMSTAELRVRLFPNHAHLLRPFAHNPTPIAYAPLQHLRSLLAVADSSSPFAAAESLGVSPASAEQLQPSQQQLRELEAQFSHFYALRQLHALLGPFSSQLAAASALHSSGYLQQSQLMPAQLDENQLELFRQQQFYLQQQQQVIASFSLSSDCSFHCADAAAAAVAASARIAARSSAAMEQEAAQIEVDGDAPTTRRPLFFLFYSTAQFGNSRDLAEFSAPSQLRCSH